VRMLLALGEVNYLSHMVGGVAEVVGEEEASQVIHSQRECYSPVQGVRDR